VTYLPRQYPEGILLMLHGQGEDGPSFCESAGATAAADARGFLVVCPSALGGHWVQPLDVEVGFLNAVLDEVGASVSTTTSRVYVAGFSGGGWAAFHLACSMSDRIDGIAAIAAPWPPSDQVGGPPAAWTESCSPSRPLPVLNAIGRRDVVFTDPAANIDGWRAFSADVMGYLGQPRPIPAPKGVLCWQYPPLAGAPAPHVSRYCTYDLAHVWPGSANADDNTGSWNATLAAWDFFAATNS
jgi:poly(3-hydroxybutyrate) depolymerase